MKQIDAVKKYGLSQSTPIIYFRKMKQKIMNFLQINLQKKQMEIETNEDTTSPAKLLSI